MPFRWASSSKSCLQYKVRAHRFWLSRKADRDIVDIVFCDRFIFPKSPSMRRYFHERNKNILYMNFAFLICDVSIKTWINKKKHDFFTALLAQLTAHVNLPDSFIAPAHIGSYSQTSSYEETVIACGIGIYQCNDCATGAAHTVCVCVMKICLLYVGTRQNFTDCRHLIGLLIYTTCRGAGWEILVGIWQNCIILLFLFSLLLRTLCGSIAIVCRAVEGHVCKSLPHKLQWMLIERWGRLLANGYGFL